MIPKREHARNSEQTYFVTSSTWERRPLFRAQPFAELFVAVLQQYRGFSFRVKKEMCSNAEIWQRGFSDHRIRDWEDYRQHREYIHLNPVRAGLCGDAKKYPYCSYGGGWDAVPQRLKPPELDAARHG